MGLPIRRASRIITQGYDAALHPVEWVVNQFTMGLSANVPINKEQRGAIVGLLKEVKGLLQRL